MSRGKENISININSKDETKSEIVYNNIISSMDKMALTKDEQLEYLKLRITELEQDHKSKFQLIVLTIIFAIILAFGLFLIVEDFNTLGIIISFVIFFISNFTIYRLSRNYKKDKNNKYEEIEAIRKLINSHLK